MLFAGKFWIDPNQGSMTDAIQAHCKFGDERGHTCFNAEKVDFSGMRQKRDAVVDRANGELPKRYVLRAQVRVLQVLSTVAEQVIKIPCSCWTDSYSIRVWTWDNQLLKPKNKRDINFDASPCMGVSFKLRSLGQWRLITKAFASYNFLVSYRKNTLSRLNP